MQLDDGAALNHPEQPQVIDAGEWSLAITAEKIKRPPTQRRSARGPSSVEETTTIVNEAQPAPRRHITLWFVRIEPRQGFCPYARRAAVILNDGGPFFLGIAPYPCDICDIRDFGFDERAFCGVRCRKSLECRVPATF